MIGREHSSNCRLFRFTEDIYEMTGYRPGLYWQLTWRYIGPAIMTCILVSSVLFMVIDNPKYGTWNSELGLVMPTNYPGWAMMIALCMITAGILPIPVTFLLRRFQILKVDLDIHQGSIRRNETTASTKEMIDDDDVSTSNLRISIRVFCVKIKNYHMYYTRLF